jgi:hypothetical protein
MLCNHLSFSFAAAALALQLGAGTPAPAQAAMTARDQGNGEILLEWSAQPDAVSYRVERMAAGIPTVSLEAGDGLNAMDFAGLASSYQYRLMARGADGNERQVGGYFYQPPADIVSRATQAAGRVPQLRSALGTNLNAISYFTTQAPFVDLMKTASAWVSGDAVTWDNRQPLDLDDNGWVRSLVPGQVARTTLAVEGYPAGEYLVRYKGEGTLYFDQAASIVPGSQRPGELLIALTPARKALAMHVLATSPENYLREIQIIMPGGVCEGDPFRHAASAPDCSGRFLSFAEYSRSLVFNPVFVDRLRAYSVVRFMDWMKTNGNGATPNPVSSWSQRTPLSYRTWTKESGAPVEVMIALANRVGAHPWFNMPHVSDDAYAHNFALAVKARLDAALGVYIEHSNEVWNAIFPQYAYAVVQGAAQNPAIDAMQYHALRSRTVGKIFEQVLGAQRAVTLLGAQAGNSWTATRGLDYLKTRFGGSAAGIDAVAIAPYFGVTPDPSNAATFASMTLDALFSYAGATLLPMSATAIQDYRVMASRYDVKLIAYEGGQHMVGVRGAENDPLLTELFHGFNRDPRINQLYLDYFAEWKRSGGELFVHFTDVAPYTKWGAWGSLEYAAQPRAAAPKFDALQTFIEQNAVWWAQ